MLESDARQFHDVPPAAEQGAGVPAHALFANGVLASSPQPSSGPLGEVDRRIELLVAENQRLQRELSRCYQHLGVVFEITETISQFQHTEKIQSALLERYAELLQASSILIATTAGIERVRTNTPASLSAQLDTATIGATLEHEIAITRRTRRTNVPRISSAALRQLRGSRVLLGALIGENTGCNVVVALRDPDQPEFDSSDQLASETVLVYGGHILNSVQMVAHLKKASLETVCALANAIDARDAYTRGHSERVGWLARITGKALDLPKEELQWLDWAGMLHDVGKIGVPEEILNKPGKLTDQEFERVKVHARLGYEVLKPVSSLEPVLDAVLYHHENHDGSGYPRGLKGDQIPLPARILRVADTFDALTSSRTYRDGMTIQAALRVIEEGAGRSTDPHITRAFLGAVRRFVRERPNEFFKRFDHLTRDTNV